MKVLKTGDENYNWKMLKMNGKHCHLVILQELRKS